MPWNTVMPKYKAGSLHSGSKSGPKVTSQSQAVAIMLSEKKASQGGKGEYKAQNDGPVQGLKAAVGAKGAPFKKRT